MGRAGRRSNRKSNRGNSRRGSTRGRTGGGLTPMNDTVTLTGSDILSTLYQTTASVPQPVFNNTSNFIALRPAVLADRIANMAALYSKYRLMNMRITFKSVLASTYSGSIALGVLDDAPLSNYTGNILTFDQVVNLRRSQDSNVWKDFSFTWRTLDGSKWYDTNTSGSDVRFTTPATLFGAVSVNTAGPTVGLVIGTVRLEYRIQFSGAIPVILPSLTKLITDLEQKANSFEINDPEKEQPVEGGDPQKTTVRLESEALTPSGFLQVHETRLLSGVSNNTNSVDVKSGHRPAHFSSYCCALNEHSGGTPRTT